MAEYIKREAAIDACFNGWNNNAHDCAENIRSIPAADVRSVVLCKDCRFRDECAFDADDDFFCASGERYNCGADMRGKQDV